jgi:hypothetical protein
LNRSGFESRLVLPILPDKRPYHSGERPTTPIEPSGRCFCLLRA